MTETVYIGLGANMDQPVAQILSACEAIKSMASRHEFVVSSLYRSAPMGPQDQNDYINAVARFNTELTPLELLEQLQRIEQTHGRVRKKERWGPRTLDLDLLLFGDQVIVSERLTVPHYGMRKRAFVIYPLLEIAPDLTLPDGTQLDSIANQLTLQGLTKL